MKRHPDSTQFPKEENRTDVWTVYGLVRNCRLIYVGCTSRPRQRLTSHQCTNFPHHEVHMVVFATFPYRGAALAVESTLVDALDPEYNRITEVPKMWDREIWLSSLEPVEP